MAEKYDETELPEDQRLDAFRTRLRAVMAHFDMKRQDLAELCNVKEYTVNAWVGGGNYAPAHKMILLREKTGVSLDWLYGGKIVNMDENLRRKLNVLVKEDPFVKH